MANSKSELVLRGYGKFDTVASNLQSAVLLLIRVCCGLEFFISGRGHLNHVPDMVQNFKDWGVPFPQPSVYISGYTEMVGGLLLLVGLLSRLISVPLTFNFVVAFLTASKATVHGLIAGPDRLDAFNKFTSDDAFFPLVAMLVILAFGPGKVSLDFILSRSILRKRRLLP